MYVENIKLDHVTMSQPPCTWFNNIFRTTMFDRLRIPGGLLVQGLGLFKVFNEMVLWTGATLSGASTTMLSRSLLRIISYVQMEYGVGSYS